MRLVRTLENAAINIESKFPKNGVDTANVKLNYQDILRLIRLVEADNAVVESIFINNQRKEQLRERREDYKKN